MKIIGRQVLTPDVFEEWWGRRENNASSHRSDEIFDELKDLTWFSLNRVGEKPYQTVERLARLSIVPAPMINAVKDRVSEHDDAIYWFAAHPTGNQFYYIYYRIVDEIGEDFRERPVARAVIQSVPWQVDNNNSWSLGFFEYRWLDRDKKVRERYQTHTAADVYNYLTFTIPISINQQSYK